MTDGQYINCEGIQCDMPVGFYSNEEIAYMRELGLPILCINCIHVTLEGNERDRIELSDVTGGLTIEY